MNHWATISIRTLRVNARRSSLPRGVRLGGYYCICLMLLGCCFFVWFFFGGWGIGQHPWGKTDKLCKCGYFTLCSCCAGYAELNPSNCDLPNKPLRGLQKVLLSSLPALALSTSWHRRSSSLPRSAGIIVIVMVITDTDIIIVLCVAKVVKNTLSFKSSFTR